MEQNIISKGQFELLFNNNESAILYVEKNKDEYKILYGNNQAKVHYDNQIEGKLLSEILPTSRFEMFINHCHKAIENKKEIEYEDFNFEEENQYKYKITLFPAITKEKVYFLCIFKKIDVVKQIDEKNHFIESIFDDSFLYAILLSKDGKLLKVNSQFKKDFNFDFADLKGKYFFELPFIEKEHKDSLEDAYHKVLAGQSLNLKKINLIASNGELRQFISSFTPLKLSNSNIIDSILIVMDDITQILKQEKALKSAEQYLYNYRWALNTAAEVTITDTDGYILDVNDRFAEQSGYTKEELIGKKHSILKSNYHTNEFYKNLWTTIKNGKIWRGEIRNITKYGTYFWNDSTIIPLLNEDGEIVQYLSVSFNITEKKSMIAELRNIEHMFKLITENTNDLIVLMNQEGIISYVSSAYERKLGYKKEELIGQFYTKILSKESKAIWNNELGLLNLTENRKIELIHHTKKGAEFWAECNYTVVKDYVDNKGSQIIMIAREINERKEFENKLLYLAYHDVLTQLPNRRYISNEFPGLIEEAKSRNESLAVLYVDGDNFKRINDEFGHNIGDEFIYHFGNTLAKSVRSHDIVARMGGDEFLVILTGLSRNEELRESQLKHIISRLNENLENGWEIDNKSFSATASIGVSFYPDHGDTLHDLLESSDHALYEIKLSSKNNFKIFGKID